MKKNKKLKKIHIIILALFFVAYVFLKINYIRYPKADLMLGEQKIEVQIARTDEHRYQGLSGRDYLLENTGMLFVFDEADQYAMVMRDMNFPIDIVWFLNNKVVDMAPNVPVEYVRDDSELIRYYPRTKANYVLELPAGWLDKNPIKIDDEVLVL